MKLSTFAMPKNSKNKIVDEIVDDVYMLTKSLPVADQKKIMATAHNITAAKSTSEDT